MKNIKPLTTLLDDPTLHQKFIGSVVKSIENHIQSMGAIKGIVIKKAYNAIKSIRPGYVEHILEVISKDYVREFTDLHEKYREEQHLPAEFITPLPDFMKQHQDEAERKANSLIGKSFQTFRPTIQNHLPTALKMIFEIIESYTLYEVEP